MKHPPDPQMILMNIYEDYYCKYCEIKYIFFSKSKEFSWCMKHNLLSKYEISCWKKSFLRLKNLIKETLSEYDKFDAYLTNKFYNMCLINKITRKYFSINDDSKTTFTDNYVIIQLKKKKKDNIIEIIKSFINPYIQSFEGWLTNEIDYFI